MDQANPVQRLHDLAVSDSGFVFDPYTGNTFSINGTGRAIIDGLRKGLAREDIVESLREGFDVAQEDLQRDLDDFVSIPRREDILPVDFVV